ncbi:MAG: two-component system, OmpR family, phosphate regulon response regulator OmpR [Solirubrobacteraceae bacterium]|nr:two-component system, OmpR family, phosphate regulon response regulator OmpR [Solirubrobacteraceae bacterium]
MALILIADDDEIVIDLVRDVLGARGHIVGAVDDGTMVITIVELKRPDLVILDCAMPEMSGVEALRQIRYSHSCHSTPVLMLTARRSEADEDIAIRAGANDYLRKPFDPDQLVSRVETLLRHAELKKQPVVEKSPLYRPPPSPERRWGQR